MMYLIGTTHNSLPDVKVMGEHWWRGSMHRILMTKPLSFSLSSSSLSSNSWNQFERLKTKNLLPRSWRNTDGGGVCTGSWKWNLYHSHCHHHPYHQTAGISLKGYKLKTCCQGHGGTVMEGEYAQDPEYETFIILIVIILPIIKLQESVWKSKH